MRQLDAPTSRPTGTNPPGGIPADLPPPLFSTEPDTSRVQTDPHTNRTKERSQTWAHPLQIRILSLMIVYSLIIFFMLAIPVFRPLTQAVVNPALSWQERARVATDLLTLHDRYWPWALGAGFVLAVQCVHAFRAMSQITEPLNRLRRALPHIRDGNLSARTTLYQDDYLADETALLNQMTAQLKARLSACKQAQATLALDFDQLKQLAMTKNEPDVVRLMTQMDHDLTDLKSALDWFKTHQG
ncbi:MAG: hypothetical protein ABL970_16340 [Nitrospira sp.]